MSNVVTYEKLITALKALKFEETPYGGIHVVLRQKSKGAFLILKKLRKNEHVPIQILANVKRTLSVKGFSLTKFNELLNS